MRMHRIRGWGVAFPLFLLSSGALGQEARPVRTGLELSPFVGMMGDRPEFGPSDVFLDPDRHVLWGGYLGYHFPQRFFIELEGGFYPWEMLGTFGEKTDVYLWLAGASVGYTWPVAESLDLFASVGAGLARWDPRGAPSESDLMLIYDAGARYFFTPRVALRGDLRMHHLPDALGPTAAQVSDVSLQTKTLWAPSLTAGVSVFIGGPSDADRDGVADAVDACPDTPSGVAVDARGCPPDSDRDGVADYMDRCPNTPPGVDVTSSGCPRDSDNDGIFDGIDRCPNTPSGAHADASGCPVDSDHDGVFDGIDRCADTPAGAKVRADGCPRDSDGDGVFDGIDRCPGTAAGTPVDAHGCPESEVQRTLEEGKTFTFGDVNFSSNSAALRPAADSILDEVGRLLTSHPHNRLELTGYTDSVGTAAYNRALGRRRAQAVRDYLLRRFPGLTASRFEVRGLGESRPVADNRTAQGRSRNRRVEIRLIQ